jgi:hypothetical protein
MPQPQPPRTQETVLEDFKVFLGPAIASRYTDSQLLQLRREMHEMAELLLDFYLTHQQDARRSLKRHSRQAP